MVLVIRVREIMAVVNEEVFMKASSIATCVVAIILLVGCNTDEVSIQSFVPDSTVEIVVTPEQSFLKSMVGLWAVDLNGVQKDVLIFTENMELGSQTVTCKTPSCDVVGASTPVVKTFDVIDHSSDDLDSVGSLKATIDGVETVISRIQTDFGFVLQLDLTDEMGETSTTRYSSYQHQFSDNADQFDRDSMSDIVGVWSSGAIINPNTNQLTEIQYEFTAKGLWDQNRYLCSEAECYQRTLDSSIGFRWSPQSTRVVDGYVVYDVLSYLVHPQLNVPYNIVYDHYSMTVDHSGSDSVLYMWNRKTDKPNLNQPLTKLPN